MRYILAAASALAIGSLFAVTAAQAQNMMTHSFGGPAREGNSCWVSTDDNGEMERYGYWSACPQQAQSAPAPTRVAKRAKKTRS